VHAGQPVLQTVRAVDADVEERQPTNTDGLCTQRTTVTSFHFNFSILMRLYSLKHWRGFGVGACQRGEKN
jgi:hypothetical protein